MPPTSSLNTCRKSIEGFHCMKFLSLHADSAQNYNFLFWGHSENRNFCLTALRNTMKHLIVWHYWAIDNFEIHLIWSLKPGFHCTANTTTTTQKQSDYRVEQSSFTPIALFWLEIGRCRGRNWLNGNQALSQLRPRQRPISSPIKAISVKDDCSTL